MVRRCHTVMVVMSKKYNDRKARTLFVLTRKDCATARKIPYAMGRMKARKIFSCCCLSNPFHLAFRVAYQWMLAENDRVLPAQYRELPPKEACHGGGRQGRAPRQV